MSEVAKITMFKKMDNVGYEEDTEKGTELRVVQTKSEPSTSYASTSCRPEVCQAARQRFPGPDLRGSPWSRNKSIFLAVILGLLFLWIIIYATLNQLNFL